MKRAERSHATEALPPLRLARGGKEPPPDRLCTRPALLHRLRNRPPSLAERARIAAAANAGSSRAQQLCSRSALLRACAPRQSGRLGRRPARRLPTPREAQPPSDATRPRVRSRQTSRTADPARDGLASQGQRERYGRDVEPGPQSTARNYQVTFILCIPLRHAA